MTIRTSAVATNKPDLSAPSTHKAIFPKKKSAARATITFESSPTGTSRNERSNESRLSANDRHEESSGTCPRDVTPASTDNNDTSSLRANTHTLANLRGSISTKDVLSAVLGQEPSEVTKLRDEETKKKNIPPPPPPIAPPPTPLTPNTLVEVLTEDISRGAKEVRQDIESIIRSDGVATARVSESEADNNASFTDIMITDYVPEEVSNAMINMGIINKAPEVKPKTYWERAEEMFSVDGLTYKQRLIGCGSCMAVGYFLSFGSVFRINALLKGNPMPYILTATLGNIVALCGSCFLSGPRAQTRNMFQRRRRLASCGYLGSLLLTIAFAFKIGMSGQKQIMIALMACQYLSIAVYCLSYVPFLDEIIQVLCLKLRKIAKGKNGEEEDEGEDLPDFRMMV